MEKARVTHRDPVMSTTTDSSHIRTTEGSEEPWKFPEVSVTQGNETFCEIHSCFSVPVSPDDVYDLITDPENKRVFKNIKEVTYRKVLQDDGNKQIVEVEQVAGWRFLVFSGSFSSRVIVEQDREQHTMLFDLLRQGMMKKFSGSWKIDALTASCSNDNNNESRETEEMWSLITFNQVVEPSIVPPWPLNGYVRGVTAKLVKEILGDLQGECLRIAQSRKANEKNDHKDEVSLI